MSRTRKLGLGLGIFVLLVIGARIAAPHFIQQYVNRTLNGLDGYSGRIGDVDLHLWRGAYEIEDVNIVKDAPGEKDPLPLVSVKRVDISVHWGALFDGSIVGEIELYGPKLNLVAEKKESEQEQEREQREAQKATRGESSWQRQVKDLVPLKINRIGIRDGELHYRDLHTKPKVDVYVQQLKGHVDNLTNSEEISETLAATAHFEGVAMGSGKLTLDGRIDPYEKTPTFELDAQLEALEIKQLNDFLRAYANVDVERGTLSVYTEVACEKGRFKGYVKPLVRNLRVLRWKDEEEGVLGKLWEGLVEAGTELFENHPKEQVATRIPFSGRLESPDADISTTVLYILRNAFIRALQGGLDESIGDGLTASRGDNKKKDD